jgi:hypothetical protein
VPELPHRVGCGLIHNEVLVGTGCGLGIGWDRHGIERALEIGVRGVERNVDRGLVSGDCVDGDAVVLGGDPEIVRRDLGLEVGYDTGRVRIERGVGSQRRVPD